MGAAGPKALSVLGHEDHYYIKVYVARTWRFLVKHFVNISKNEITQAIIRLEKKWTCKLLSVFQKLEPIRRLKQILIGPKENSMIANSNF